MAGGWNFKYIFYCMERTYEPLHLDTWSFVHWKILDIAYVQVYLSKVFWMLEISTRRPKVLQVI
jgi:hypothetical protein